MAASCRLPPGKKLTASPVAMVTCSKLPSEDGSVISDESERLRSSRGLMVLKVTAQQRATEQEARKKDGEREATHCFVWWTGVSGGGVAVGGRGVGWGWGTGKFWSWYGVRSANSRDGRDGHGLVTHCAVQ